MTKNTISTRLPGVPDVELDEDEQAIRDQATLKAEVQAYLARQGGGTASG